MEAWVRFPDRRTPYVSHVAAGGDSTPPMSAAPRRANGKLAPVLCWTLPCVSSFLAESNPHPSTEINYNHKRESFSGSCGPFERILPSEGALGDSRHRGLPSPFPYACSSCESCQGLRFIRGHEIPIAHPRPREGRPTCTLTGRFSELSLSPSSSSMPTKD